MGGRGWWLNKEVRTQLLGNGGRACGQMSKLQKEVCVPGLTRGGTEKWGWMRRVMVVGFFMISADAKGWKGNTAIGRMRAFGGLGCQGSGFGDGWGVVGGEKEERDWVLLVTWLCSGGCGW